MKSMRQKGHCMTSEAMKQRWCTFHLETQSPPCKEVQTHWYGRPNGVGLCGVAKKSPVTARISHQAWAGELPDDSRPQPSGLPAEPQTLQSRDKMSLPEFLRHKLFEYNKSLSSMSAWAYSTKFSSTDGPLPKVIQLTIFWLYILRCEGDTHSVEAILLHEFCMLVFPGLAACSTILFTILYAVLIHSTILVLGRGATAASQSHGHKGRQLVHLQPLFTHPVVHYQHRIQHITWDIQHVIIKQASWEMIVPWCELM